jgi:hypothetical protein
VIAVSTPLFTTNPQFPVDRTSGSHTSTKARYGIYYNYGPGESIGAVGVVCVPHYTALKVIYEFFNTSLRHYFRTSSTDEAAAIDNGAAGPGWERTGDNFYAYTALSNTPGSDVCRFYTFGANSHFYTAFASECESLKAEDSGWVYEGLSFRIPLPFGPNCGPDTVPVYRLYNNGFATNDSNHRFTIDARNIAPLEVQGWTYEGVAFCALDL